MNKIIFPPFSCRQCWWHKMDHNVLTRNKEEIKSTLPQQTCIYRKQVSFLKDLVIALLLSKILMTNNAEWNEYFKLKALILPVILHMNTWTLNMWLMHNAEQVVPDYQIKVHWQYDWSVSVFKTLSSFSYINQNENKLYLFLCVCSHEKLNKL